MNHDCISNMRRDLDELFKRKAILDEEAEKLSTEIQEIETALKVLEKYKAVSMNISRGVLLEAMPELNHSSEDFSNQETTSKRQKVVDASISILKDGKPRRTTELLNILLSKGIYIGGQNPESNLSCYLSKAKGINGLESSRLYGWHLKPKKIKTLKKEEIPVIRCNEDSSLFD